MILSLALLLKNLFLFDGLKSRIKSDWALTVLFMS